LPSSDVGTWKGSFSTAVSLHTNTRPDRSSTDASPRIIAVLCGFTEEEAVWS
jgi:hypothetical protein